MRPVLDLFANLSFKLGLKVKEREKKKLPGLVPAGTVLFFRNSENGFNNLIKPSQESTAKLGNFWTGRFPSCLSS